MCQDCVQFLTDAQQQAKANSTFVNSLIEQIESQCDLLGPGISDLVGVCLVGALPTLMECLIACNFVCFVF